MKKALISVADKTGINEFAAGLVELGFEVLSTGGTSRQLQQAGIPVTEVQQITEFPEMMDGRVKTLHPRIHGGILMRRDNPEDVAITKEHGIPEIDLVCVNLYPFAATISSQHSLEDAIENIDIGGPAMVRSAAKNHAFVAVVTSPMQYAAVLSELREQGRVSLELRRKLAVEALLHTAYYDSTISMYFWQAYGLEGFPRELGLPMSLVSGLRYGENPHQAGASYSEPLPVGGIPQAKQLQGKELSFCNINDANAALEMVKEFSRPAVVAVKHANPCGVAMADTIFEAYSKAHDADPVSIFGGIIALNRQVDKATAEAMTAIFLDVIIAPSYTDEALVVLGKKKNLRLLTADFAPAGSPLPSWDIKRIEGGYLLQTKDVIGPKDNWRVATTAEPTERQLADMEFAWILVKHTKSNAIVIARDGVSVGIGVGQTNRIDPTLQAIERAGDRVQGAVLASDAFFPMPDVLEKCAEVGITCVIQPGGSIRDNDSLEVAERAGIAMVYAGERHFKH